MDFGLRHPDIRHSGATSPLIILRPEVTGETRMKLLCTAAFILAFLSTTIAFAEHHPIATANGRLSIGQTYCTGSTACVLTAHNDNNRDGANPNESILKASTLSASSHPTPRWLATTDGLLYAQPLYVHQLMVNGAAKNVVFASTENNSIYAFDSDSTSSSGTILAQVNLNNAGDLGSGTTEIAVPYSDLPKSCGLLVPEVGITGTPVIDVSVTPPVIYVITKHEDVDNQGAKTYRQKLHGLYADTLQEIPGSPLVLDTNFAETYAPNYDPLYDHQRPGLTLISSGSGSSKVWVSWGSNCDDVPYWGLEMEFTYNYNGTPGFANNYTVVNASPACLTQPCQTGIWMGGGSPAADASGNVYLSTGNGADQLQGSGEYSNSILRLNDSGMQDFYSPPDFHGLNKGAALVACANPHAGSCPAPCSLDTTGQFCQVTLQHDDWDLGAGGVLLLQPSFKLNNPEIVASGKQGMIYLAYANSLGHVDSHEPNPSEYACTPSNEPATGAIAQCFQGFSPSTNPEENDSGLRGSPAFLAGNPGSLYNLMYAAGVNEPLKAFLLLNHNGVGTFFTTPGTAISPHIFKGGASPSVTWNKAKAGAIGDAIVWATDPIRAANEGKQAGPETLYAYRAIPSSRNPSQALGTELWDSSAYNSTNPGNPGSVKFVVPTIADGQVFLGGGAQGYVPGGANCPVPSTTTQPTACGGLAMFK